MEGQNYFKFDEHHLNSLNLNTIERQKYINKQQQQVKLCASSLLDRQEREMCRGNQRTFSLQGGAQSYELEGGGSRVRRKLFNFIYVYAIIIITLYVTYAGYYFYQHHSNTQIKQSQPEDSATRSNQNRAEQLISDSTTNPDSKLENKLHLLERYIELIALDLEETKNRLKEREKCDCSTSCTFNSTKYADQSSWQNQCDICTCSAGKISCVPQKCPQLNNCDVAITLPGQCCPTCMKKCKYNSTILRHGEKFNRPSEAGRNQTKECKCHDGLIKCEQKSTSLAKSKAQAPSQKAANVGQLALAAGNSTQFQAAQMNLVKLGSTN